MSSNFTEIFATACGLLLDDNEGILIEHDDVLYEIYMMPQNNGYSKLVCDKYDSDNVLAYRDVTSMSEQLMPSHGQKFRIHKRVIQ